MSPQTSVQHKYPSHLKLVMVATSQFKVLKIVANVAIIDAWIQLYTHSHLKTSQSHTIPGPLHIHADLV